MVVRGEGIQTGWRVAEKKTEGGERGVCNHVTLWTHISVADPCQFGGTCTNTNGSFSCQCADGFTGLRCQYSTVCETQSPCPSNLTCVATVTNAQGYVCQEVGVAGSVVVTNPASSPGLLDDQVNSLMETQEVRERKVYYVIMM